MEPREDWNTLFQLKGQKLMIDTLCGQCLPGSLRPRVPFLAVRVQCSNFSSDVFFSSIHVEKLYISRVLGTYK